MGLIIGFRYCKRQTWFTDFLNLINVRLILNCRRFVAAFIDFPKPLIGVINGPAIGVSVTVLGLFDLVYATDKVIGYILIFY